MTAIDPVITALVIGRGLLFSSGLPNVLREDHQITSPLTSFIRLKEGIFLFDSGFDPYSGGVFRHSPLLLSAFATYLPTSEFGSGLLWTLLDALGAWALISIYRARCRKRGTSRVIWQERLVASAYLLNPYLILPNLGRSTASFENSLILLSIRFADSQKPSAALLLLALATHLSIHNILLMPPIALVLMKAGVQTAEVKDIPSEHSSLSSRSSSDVPAKPHTTPTSLMLVLLSQLVLLSVVGTLVSGGTHWMERTWLASLTLPDLTPNPGLWWYFFTEMFDHFRPFFLIAFSMHILIYVAPICMAFSHDPLYATFLMQGIIATLKPYPTLADPGLFISMFALFPEVIPYLRHPLVTILWHMHAALLLPLFHSLWLSQGTGNANFYYATTLVFGISMTATMIDAVWAGLRIGFGPKRRGWEIIQI